MYLMYIDESGDPGTGNSPTRYFILCGIVVHELAWKKLLEDLIAFRRTLKAQHTLKLREEIHASYFINTPGELIRIPRHDRLYILRQCIDWLAAHPEISIISTVIDKHNNQNKDVFEIAWQTLIQRFENTIAYRNFPNNVNTEDMGLIIPDNTDGQKLSQLLRKMRRYNPIPNPQNTGYRDLPLTYVIEDPVLRNSAVSYFHQMVDVVAYSLRQSYEPNSYMKKKGGHNFYNRLEPVVCKKASGKHPLGVVEL